MANNSTTNDARALDGQVIARAQKRLISEYSKLGSWQALSDFIGIKNKRYAWEFCIKGVVPRDPEKRKALGLPKVMPSERRHRAQRILPKLGSPEWEPAFFKRLVPKKKWRPL